MPPVQLAAAGEKGGGGIGVSTGLELFVTAFAAGFCGYLLYRGLDRLFRYFCPICGRRRCKLDGRAEKEEGKGGAAP